MAPSLRMCPRTFVVNFVAVVAVVATGCSGLTDSEPRSETSDFRTVLYEDLLPRIDQFSETGVSHFSEILFDFARYQVKPHNNPILWTPSNNSSNNICNNCNYNTRLVLEVIVTKSVRSVSTVLRRVIERSPTFHHSLVI